MVDLNTRLANGAGWLLVEAHAINDAGQIVAWADHAGQRRVVFLQPIPKLLTVVPCGGSGGVVGGGDGLTVKG